MTEKTIADRLAALEKTCEDFETRLVALGERVVVLEKTKPAKGGDVGELREGVNVLHVQLFGVPFGKTQSQSDD